MRTRGEEANVGRIPMDKVYDDFAEAFAKSDPLLTWQYVGKPALEKMFGDHLHEQSLFLDLGSASARVEMEVLLPRGVRPENITGIDISPEQVKIARQRVPGAKFFVGDISGPSLLSENNAAFDVVFSHMVFEHLDDEQLERTFQNAHRLLNPDGIFAFVVTHPDKMTDLEGNLVATYGSFETSAPWGGVLHNWRRSVKQTLSILEAANFAIELQEELEFPGEVSGALDEEAASKFHDARKRYSRYPAIRLAIRARKS